LTETVPFVPGERFSVADPPIDPGSGPMTVQDMLKAHAMAGLPAAQDAADRAPASRAPSASAPPVNPEASLAETTRRAQESLSTLMNQLAAATHALQAANGAGRK
jgi:hypothetical protein